MNILEIKKLSKSFKVDKKIIPVLDEISLNESAYTILGAIKDAGI